MSLHERLGQQAGDVDLTALGGSAEESGAALPASRDETATAPLAAD